MNKNICINDKFFKYTAEKKCICDTLYTLLLMILQTDDLMVDILAVVNNNILLNSRMHASSVSVKVLYTNTVTRHKISKDSFSFQYRRQLHTSPISCTVYALKEKQLNLRLNAGAGELSEALHLKTYKLRCGLSQEQTQKERSPMMYVLRCMR